MPAQCSDFGQSVTWMTKSFLCYFQRTTLFLLNRMLRSISCMPSICPNRTHTHTQKKTLEIARFVAKIINTKKNCGRLSFGEKEHIHPSKNEISPKHDMLLRPPSSCRRLFRRFSTFLTFLAFEGRFFQPFDQRSGRVHVLLEKFSHLLNAFWFAIQFQMIWNNLRNFDKAFISPKYFIIQNVNKRSPLSNPPF